MVQNQVSNSQPSPTTPPPQPLFQFHVNEVVLARHQGELYYAKIVSVHLNKKTARVLFDDGSKDEIAFDHIHNGEYTLYTLFTFIKRVSAWANKYCRAGPRVGIFQDTGHRKINKCQLYQTYFLYYYVFVVQPLRQNVYYQ